MTHEAIALWTETSSDPELIAGVRAGDGTAFGVLYERHVDAARKVAAQYTNSPSDVDDVVAESFSRVLRALQRGDGPDLAFRAYLFTIVRRTGLDIINRGNRTKPGDDMAQYESAMGYEAPSDEGTLVGFEQGIVADAFRSLPERWQAVLWYTEVEKKSPKEIAPLLGLTANGVAALAYRAREALRQAYLQQHLSGADSLDCLAASAQLGAYVRGGLAKREHAKVDEHVRSCEKCTALVAELEDVNRGMRGIIAPLILGIAGLGALEGGLPIGGALGPGGAASAGGAGGASGAAAAGGAGTASAAGVGMAAWVASTSSVVLPAAAALGVVALVVSGASYLGVFNPLGDSSDPGPVVAESPTSEPTDNESPSNEPTASPEVSPEPSAEPSTEPSPAEEDPQPRPDAGPGTTPERTPGIAPGGGPGTGGGTNPTPDPTTDPTPDPTTDPTTDPTPDPTTDPTTEPTPDPTTDPPPPPPPVKKSKLSFGAAPLETLEISATTPAIGLNLGNGGDGDASDVTASITLPTGLTFAPPSGGGGGAMVRLSGERVGAFLSFAADDSFPVGAWTCELNSSRSVATCELGSLAAGATEDFLLELAPITDATHVADDAVVTFRAQAGEDVTEYRVHTQIEKNEENLEHVFSESGHLAAVQVGSTLMGCSPSSACTGVMGYAGAAGDSRYNNNSQQMVALNRAGGVHNSGSTELGPALLPKGATVKFAILEWSANRHQTDVWSGATDTARIKAPHGEYQTITADSVDSHLDDGRYYYQARADVTELVATAGNGTYSVADIALTATKKDPGPTYYGGFSLTVVYELPSLPVSSVAVFSGSQWVKSNLSSDFSFYTANTSDVTVGWTTWEADRGTAGDRLTIDRDDLTPLGWDGKGTLEHDTKNAADATAFGSEFANTLGVDSKSFKALTGLKPGVHRLEAWTGGDNYLISSITVTIAAAK